MKHELHFQALAVELKIITTQLFTHFQDFDGFNKSLNFKRS